MAPTIKDRAVKCLHKLESFKAAPIDQAEFRLNPGETLLGVYKPIGIGPTDIRVVITDLGMHWELANERHFVKYSQIREINYSEGVTTKKQLGEQPELRDLSLVLDSGKTIRLPIRGQYDHYLDMTDVWRFLNYVLSDSEREARKAKKS
jgi:hypothetical protein